MNERLEKGVEVQPSPEPLPWEITLEEIKRKRETDPDFEREAREIAEEGLGKIELTEKVSCQGTIIEGEKQREVEFGYYTQTVSAQEMLKRGLLEQEVIDQLRNQYGLTNFNFKVSCRMKGEIGEKAGDEDWKKYVLLPGWTANHKIFGVKRENGLNIEEEIMARDENAIVISIDGNGFGETRFDPTLPEEELTEKCTAEAYADQDNFFLSEILGLRYLKDQVGQIGHSMGGAACYWKTAKYGYRCVAVAPAAFTTEEDLEHAEKAEIRKKIEESLREPRKIDIDLIYTMLGRSTALSKHFGRIGDWARVKVFEVIAPHLMGKVAESDEENIRVTEETQSIHSDEVSDSEKRGLISKAILNLKKGVKLSDWPAEYFQRMNNLSIIWGNSDALVSETALFGGLATGVALAMEKKADAISKSQEEKKWEDATEGTWNVLQNARSKRATIEGGHYKTLYSRKTLEEATWWFKEKEG